MKNQGLIAFFLLGFALDALALDFGIGVSVKSNDNAIYTPLKISESLTLEPYYRQGEYKSSDDFSSSGNESEEIGLGLFYVLANKRDVDVYIGMRAGYVERANYYESAAGDFGDKDEGYKLSPTIGFEYALLESLALSAEAEWYIYKLDGYRTDDSTRERIDFTSKGTDTRIIVRYYFE